MTPSIDPTVPPKVKLPSNLETLTFGEKFNQILELPPKLCLRFDLMTNLTTLNGWVKGNPSKMAMPFSEKFIHLHV